MRHGIAPWVAAARRAVERRSAGIGHPEQPRDLVKALARRVVARRAENVQIGIIADVDDHRVPAGDDEAEKRRLQIGIGNVIGGDMAADMMHGDQRHVQRQRCGLWRNSRRRAARRSGRAHRSRRRRRCRCGAHSRRQAPARQGRRSLRCACARRSRARRRRRAGAAPPARRSGLSAPRGRRARAQRRSQSQDDSTDRISMEQLLSEDERILARIEIVIRAPSDLRKAERPIERDCAGVGGAHLQNSSSISGRRRSSSANSTQAMPRRRSAGLTATFITSACGGTRCTPR